MILFLRPATQPLLQRVARSSLLSTSANLVRDRSTTIASPALLIISLSSKTSTITASQQRSFADAAISIEPSGSASPWKEFAMAPPDPIIGLTEV